MLENFLWEIVTFGRSFTVCECHEMLASLAELKLTYPRIALAAPSIVIMVPGLCLYRAMYYMCVFDTADMLSWLVRAVLIVAFLLVGLGVARTLSDPCWRHAS